MIKAEQICIILQIPEKATICTKILIYFLVGKYRADGHVLEETPTKEDMKHWFGKS